MKRLVAVAQLALCFMLVFCNSGGGSATPSELVGQWELAERSDGWSKNMELLKDGIGIDDGRSITWKVDGGRFYEFLSDGRSWAGNYKLSGYELLMWGEKDTAIYVRKGKLEEFKAKQATATETEKANAEVEKAKQITAAKRALKKLPKFTDSRDNTVYRKVTIGGKTWMAENLNYNTSVSVCYGGNCDKYGRLYNWNTAKQACPAGWRLPTDAEWTTLVNYAGGEDKAGKKLKSRSGWNRDDGVSGNGTNNFGFSALPGGVCGYGYLDGSFSCSGADSSGIWWSATENEDYADYAWGRIMDYDSVSVGRGGASKTDLLSVRCVQD